MDQKIEGNRPTADEKIHSAKSERRKSKLRLEYKRKDREVKHRAREDKRVLLEQMGNEVEKYAENGRTRELYQTAKKSPTSGVVKLQ